MQPGQRLLTLLFLDLLPRKGGFDLGHQLGDLAGLRHIVIGPISMALKAVSMDPCPVRISTSVKKLQLLDLFKVAIPSIPGILRSSTMTSKP